MSEDFLLVIYKRTTEALTSLRDRLEKDALTMEEWNAIIDAITFLTIEVERRDPLSPLNPKNATFAEAAKIAAEHKPDRVKRGEKLSHFDPEDREIIRTEENGEAIAASAIAAAIRSRIKT